MRKICLVLLLVSSTAIAQPSGSAAGSGSAAPAAGSATPTPGSATPTPGSATPTPGSGAGAAGSGTPAAGSGSAGPEAGAATPPADPEPNPGGLGACTAAMNADPNFADRVIKMAERKLQDRVNDEQIAKDICALRDHMDSQADVAKNKRHVLMAYIAMWLVAAGFVIFLWRKQQALKLEIANLRRDLEDATKDGK